MDGTANKMKPKTMAELLPGLSGILSKDCIQALTVKKPQQNKMVLTRTSEKPVKPLTIAEMKTHLTALKGESTRRCQLNSSVKKKNWNSSVKVDKTVSHTANGKLKNNSVRKVLNFQPKPKTNVRATINSETPKFPKPELKARKALNVQAKNNIRISGVYKIAETPAIKSNPSFKNRMTLANKENASNQTNTVLKLHMTPKQKVPLQKKLLTIVPDTPLNNNMSWKSSCDASFLQAEKDIEEKTKASQENNATEKTGETLQTVSTPFKEYRNVQDFFNQTKDIENSSLYNDNTIMCFDKLKISKENSKRDESVIVSLCDMLNKATVNNFEQESDFDNLLHVERQTEHNIEMIDNGIKTLVTIKDAQIKTLQYVRKLISEKHSMVLKSETEKITDQMEPETKKERIEPELNLKIGKPCAVIKSCSKSPSYKIPKKNPCLRKKVFHKSMPNVCNGMQTPIKDTSNKALSIYMKMKEQMNFLNTPLIKCKRTETPSTPAITSQNLQMQLDKLYNCS